MHGPVNRCCCALYISFKILLGKVASSAYTTCRSNVSLRRIYNYIKQLCRVFRYKKKRNDSNLHWAVLPLPVDDKVSLIYEICQSWADLYLSSAMYVLLIYLLTSINSVSVLCRRVCSLGYWNCWMGGLNILWWTHCGYT